MGELGFDLNPYGMVLESVLLTIMSYCFFVVLETSLNSVQFYKQTD